MVDDKNAQYACVCALISDRINAPTSPPACAASIVLYRPFRQGPQSVTLPPYRTRSLRRSSLSGRSHRVRQQVRDQRRYARSPRPKPDVLEHSRRDMPERPTSRPHTRFRFASSSYAQTGYNVTAAVKVPKSAVSRRVPSRARRVDALRASSVTVLPALSMPSHSSLASPQFLRVWYGKASSP
jgi:hypothetical protein